MIVSIHYFWSSIILVMLLYTISTSATSLHERINTYNIEGQIIFRPEDNALTETHILVNEGQYVGIPRIDGTFIISGRPYITI